MEKQLKDLNLLDKFLFDQMMEIPDAHEAMLQIILNDRNLKLMTQQQTEKELRTMPWLRSVRLDVFSMDSNRNIYDTEMQKGYRNDLVKRSRYYQGVMDASLLEPGIASYNELANVCVIMITPFDLFGEGNYCYTFRPYCEENKKLLLRDGGTRIFLNTKGRNEEAVSRELVDFLHYLENVDGDFAAQTGSPRIQKLHTYVSKIKSSEEMGVKYMQSWEEKIIDREQGRTEGRAMYLIEQICKKLRKAKSTALIAEELEEQPEKIEKICRLAEKFAPEYDEREVFLAWQKEQ